MTIDWTKPIETVNGDPLFYVGKTKDGRVLVEHDFNGMLSLVDSETGVCNAYERYRVRNVPEEPKIETRWKNLYSLSFYGYRTKHDADANSLGERTGQIEITFKDGKPVDVKLHSVGDE